MNIRKAVLSDIAPIAKIYEKIHDEEDAGNLSVGWLRNVYPTKKTAENALKRGDLFVAENSEGILGSAILNHFQGEEYKLINWKYPFADRFILVMHTLTVDPMHFKSGVGSEFVKFYQEYALSNGCKALRIDTQEKNTTARSFYKKNGFSEAGIVSCVFNGIPNVSLVLLEKLL